MPDRGRSGRPCARSCPVEATRDHPAYRRRVRDACLPRRDLRFVQYGLLGPNATSITYRSAGITRTEPTGPDGAYLVVGGPSTPAFCRQFPLGTFCGGNGDAPNSIGGGMIEAVHYRNAPTCELDRPSPRLSAWLIRCPTVGYVPAKPTLTARQLASPIRVRVIHANAYCLSAEVGRSMGSDALPLRN